MIEGGARDAGRAWEACCYWLCVTDGLLLLVQTSLGGGREGCLSVFWKGRRKFLTTADF